MAGLTINVDQTDKELFSSICNKMGMNVTTAITIFIKTVNRTRKIPFEIEAETEFNDETIAALKESLDIQKGKIQAKSYSDVKDMLSDLSIAEDKPEYNTDL